MQQEVSLADLQKGRTGMVSTINGGAQFRLKLEGLSIRPGTKITKVSSLFSKGPVVLSTGVTEVAIGYTMALKIMVNDFTDGK
ncbi:MAG: ferrous iron transport protein A [Proteobacteria bacterium]|nr:ferrous iron transport protein A [Pseudomonadota bacterium]